MKKRQKVQREGAKTSKSAEPEDFDEDAEIDELRRRCVDEAPAPGNQLSSNGAMRFENLPLSRRTLEALRQAQLTVATEIQAAAIPHALAKRDILGAAKTGSGKTLAFVIPIVERLYSERWSLDDGLAAVVITPTRELALQIFEVIRVVGKKHQLSAGLVTGGKKEFEGEQARIVKMNILVATPGRLLQHLEQSPNFDASQLLVLVLDEADRILDMGFRGQLDGILSYLPPSRQTMLFSATQTKSVKDLARLSLRQPEYLAVHDKDEHVTPEQLVQNYVVVHLPDKLDVLFSFLKTHTKSKIIVFFSTCSQVRFVHELFCSMQPGIPLTALHGKVKQEKRTLVYMDFLRKKFACMLATDIAARGLDFPAVDWVLQVDAPEDAAMYIHRVGRTARYNANGRALLMLLPSEEGVVLEALQKSSVPVKRLTINSNKTVSVAARAAALLVAQPECRQLAKKAFTGYLRSLQLSPFSSQPVGGSGGTRQQLVGDVSKLPVDKFAVSLGLAMTPPLPVVAGGMGAAGREANRADKNVNHKLDKLKRQIKEAKEAKRRAALGGTEVKVDGSDEQLGEASKVKSSRKKLKLKAAATTSVDGNRDSDSDSDSGDELLRVKAPSGKDDDDVEDDDPEDLAALLEAGKKRKRSKPLRLTADGEDKRASGSKVRFDEDGSIEQPLQLRQAAAVSDSAAAASINTAGIDEYTRRVRERVDQGRKEDRLRERQRIRDKHLSDKAKLRQARDEEGGGGPTAVLGGGDSDGGNSNSDNDSGSGDDSDSNDGGARWKKRDGKFIANSDDSGSDSDGDSGDDGGDDDRERMERMALSMMKGRGR